MTTSREQVKAAIERNMTGAKVPPEAIDAFELGARRMANKHAHQEATAIMASTDVRAGSEKPKAQQEPDVQSRLAKVEEQLNSLSLGTKTTPQAPHTFEAPAVLAKGMKRDSDPINYGGFIRGMITGNWKRADREREIHNALTTGSGSGDGLVPSIVGSEVIFDLLGVSAIGDSLTQVVNLSSGAVKVPTEDTAPSAEWVAEGDSLSVASAVFGSASIEPHDLAVYLEVTNQLVQDAPEIADQHIRQSLRNAMAKGLDTAFLNGTGASNQPLGLFAGSPGYQVDETGNSLTFDKITEAAWDILGAGGMRENLRVIAHPDAFTYLDSLRASSDGEYLQASAPVGSATVDPVRVASNKVTVTTATPDTTSLLIGDFRQAVSMYNFGPMQLAVDPSAAFQKNSIAFRVTARVDFLVKHSDLITRLDTINLG